MTQLSAHFSLKEFTVTNSGFDNTPDPKSLENLKRTAVKMELVRSACGGLPVTPTSVFRSPAVNAHEKGALTSAHLYGYAVDFIVQGLTNQQICDFILEAGIVFDQLIDEDRDGERWVHISFDPRNRGEYLKYRNGKYEVLNG